MLNPVLFFFQLLYNIPSLTLYVYNSAIELEVAGVDITYQPLQVNNLKMLRTPPDLELYGRISVCHFTHPDLKYEWMISTGKGTVYESKSPNCSFIFQTTHYDTLHLSVAILTLNNSLLARGERSIHLEKSWIAVIGDSFASGEGSPERSGGVVQWQNEGCHRSKGSFAFQVAQAMAERNKDRTFQLSFLACSGATATDLLDGYHSQISVLERIARERQHGPDTVILTIGANDIGFSDILQVLTHHSQPFDHFETRLFELSIEFDRIAERLKQIGAKQVVLPLYYDITRNEKGEVDATCGSFGKIKTLRLAVAEKTLMRKLNDLLRRKAERHNWTLVDAIPKIFSTRGVCSSRSLVISPEISIKIQQSLRGAFHPTEEGHKIIAAEVLKVIH